MCGDVWRTAAKCTSVRKLKMAGSEVVKIQYQLLFFFLISQNSSERQRGNNENDSNNIK